MPNIRVVRLIPFTLLSCTRQKYEILYKYGTWVSAISIIIALRKMILHEALAPSPFHFSECNKN